MTGRGSRLAPPVALLVAVVLAAAAAGPSTARAGNEFGAGCTSVSPGAIEPQPTHFTATTNSSYTPAHGEFSDSESLGASNFTAKAEWGDGSSSAAIVSGGTGTCYEVATGGHAYSTPGTYHFQYVVHDASTGLDHIVHAGEFFIWGVPTPIGDPSTRTVHATIGTPWTGVVAEFTNVPTPVATIGYSAEIEWGAGLPWSLGTVTDTPSGSLAVSGTNTYALPVHEAIKVKLFGGNELGTWATSTVIAEAAVVPIAHVAPPPAASHLSLVGRPIAATYRKSRGRFAGALVFRLSRVLARSASGRIQATLDSRGFGHAITSFGPHPAHACYLALGTRSAHQAPHDGSRRAFSLSASRPAPAQVAGRALTRSFSGRAAMRRTLARQLGC
jgi:hypothetical protein